MARKNRPIKVINMLSINGKDGDYKPIKEYTPEEIAYFKSTVQRKVSDVLSEHYTIHPEEYQKLVGN